MEGREEIQFRKRYVLFGIIDNGQSQGMLCSSHLSPEGRLRTNRIILYIVALSSESFKLRLYVISKGPCCSSFFETAPFPDYLRLKGIADFVELWIRQCPMIFVDQ